MVVIMPKLTLSYFPFANRAEPIRLAAVIGKVPFTNKSVAFQDFPQVKQHLPLGQLPILEIESPGKEPVVISQADAILRYFGKLGGLYPDDPIEACQVDSMIDIVDDATKPLIMTIHGAKRTFITDDLEWTNEDKIAIRKRVVEQGFPKYIGFLENAIKQNTSGWIVGSTISIADLRLYQLALWIDSGILDGVPPSTLDSYPQIRSHLERVKEMDQVAAFYSRHSPPYGDFDFVPM